MLDCLDNRVYDIYGYRYTFSKIHVLGGTARGWCNRRKKWAWLFDEYVQFEKEMPVSAVRIR